MRLSISEIIAKDQHLQENESLDDGLKRVCLAYGSSPDHSRRLYDYAKQKWFMFASPVLSNGGTNRGLPISCFLNYVPDSREGILGHYSENGWLSSMGGGIGSHWSSIRTMGQRTSRNLKTSGLIPFLHVADSQILAFSQGSTRRGAYAAYLNISHPEVLEFIDMRKPSGGDIHRKNLNSHHGVNITDAFMQCVENDSPWELKDPHSGKTVDTVRARALWQKIIETRLNHGEPYLYFIDTANKAMPRELQERGLVSRGSNLCTEITLPTDEDRTAVCCLSSINAEKYLEWKEHPDFVGDLVEMLDNVLEDFIERAPGYSEHFLKAVKSAKSERSLGLGLMGFHSFLQSRMIPFDSVSATAYATNIQKTIWERAVERSEKLARVRGAAPDCPSRRNAHLIAIAPNATSSFILDGVSPGIEPVTANSYTAKTKSLNFTWRNKELYRWVGDPENNQEIWRKIHANNGSVQEIPGLPDDVKDVFKTAYEIDQAWVITHAAQRQRYIDQAQSINLFFNEVDDAKYISDVHRTAWKLGVKSLYYIRTQSIRRPENIQNKINRVLKDSPTVNADSDCVACEG